MKITAFPGVYRPAEDTFFLASWLERQPLKDRRVLDMGTGTGYLAVLAALRDAHVDATDISPRALLNARYNAKQNGVHVRTVLSDLFEAIHGRYDIIVFNPPYLSPWEEARDPSWDGGYPLLRAFLEDLPSHLLPGGCGAFVLEEDENWRKIEPLLENARIERNAFHLIRVVVCP